MSRKGKAAPFHDLWAMASALQPEYASEKCPDTRVIVLGDYGSGKSTLVSLFLNPQKELVPKPTVALEYSFARRASGPAAPKDVAHIYELGGDMIEPELLHVPLCARNMLTARVVICCDLSKPQNAIPSLINWIKIIHLVCSRNMGDLQQNQPSLFTSVRGTIQARALPESHVDRARVQPFLVPLMIVATKYDIFKDMETAKRRTMLQALRFIAHTHQASLVCASSVEKTFRDTFRSYMTALCFNTGFRPLLETNLERPTVICAGRDSFQEILKPSIADVDDTDLLTTVGVAPSCMQALMEMSNRVFDAPNIPKSAQGDNEIEAEAKGDAESAKYMDPDIDELKSQKDAELDRYRQQQLRRQQTETKQR